MIDNLKKIRLEIYEFILIIYRQYEKKYYKFIQQKKWPLNLLGKDQFFDVFKTNLEHDDAEGRKS